MKTIQTDAAVIGAGAAGMAAAIELLKAGRRVVLVDRETRTGGILNQCIHNGFGLHAYGEELTGPEFAGRLALELSSAAHLSAAVGSPDFELWLGTTVQSIQPAADGPLAGPHRLVCVSPDRGVVTLEVQAIVLAMGSRERNRGNVRIPGSRPAGVFTAGLAQRLVNIDGYLPGKEVVIIGSGDIGLIMARRLSWSGCRVKAVVEIMAEPSGLARNISQCLDDFGIPLYLSSQTTRIFGRERVEGVEVTPLEGGRLQTEKAFRIDCDTVLLSVGLVPENELSRAAGIALSPATGGALVDGWHMTNIPGIFSCGNVLHVHDLVDWVVAESREAARAAVRWLAGERAGPQLATTSGANVRYVNPSSLDPAKGGRLSLRPLISARDAVLTVTAAGRIVRKKKLPRALPPEMLQLDFAPGELAGLPPGTTLECSIETEAPHA